MSQSTNPSDSALLASILPREARELEIDGLRGWTYSISDPYGAPYEFFLWKDGDTHRVTLVGPAIEKRPDAAQLYVNQDGSLHPVGANATMTAVGAFKMSVAWVAFCAISDRISGAAERADASVASKPS